MTPRRGCSKQNAAESMEGGGCYRSAMPEDGSMTNAERIQLGQWLSCGAPSDRGVKWRRAVAGCIGTSL